MMGLKSAAALGVATLVAASASAVEIEIYLLGTIEDPASTGLVAFEDQIEITVKYESTPPEGLTGNYPSALYDLEIFLIDDSDGAFIPTFLSPATNGVFVGTDEFNVDFGPAPQQLGDNFSFTLRNSSVPFGQSLATATTELTNAADPLSLFGEGDGRLQNDDTFEDLLFIIDDVTFTVVPEPTSLAMLAGLGLLAMGRRRR